MQPSVQFVIGQQSGTPSATMIFNIVKIKLPVLSNLIIGLFGQSKFGNEMPIFFTIGSTKCFIQCFHYSISIQIIICDILYRLSLPLVFETFVMGSRHSAGRWREFSAEMWKERIDKKIFCVIMILQLFLNF